MRNRTRQSPLPKDVVPTEVAAGRDQKAPVFAIGGTALVLTLLFLLALCLVLIGYLLAR